MEIKYYTNYGFLCVSFREWKDAHSDTPKKYYFNYNGCKQLVPEGGVVPADCIFMFPTGIGEPDFEGAVLALANEIINKRNSNSDNENIVDTGEPIDFMPKQTTEDKLIDIIQKLVSK